jgi:hypothetical protein
MKKKILLIIILLFSRFIPTLALDIETIEDDLDDFLIVEGSESLIFSSLKPVDITEVKVYVQNNMMYIVVSTRDMMPSVGPDYPEAYVCSIAVMADNDESKLVTADLIIDEFGWDPWVRYTNEPEKVDVHQEGQNFFFIFDLDMEDWGPSPKVMSFYVHFGYEHAPGRSLVRVYDLVPNQNWVPGEGHVYFDYSLPSSELEPEPEPELEVEPEPEEVPEKPGGIPGFGFESVLAGVIVSTLVIGLMSKRFSS